MVHADPDDAYFDQPRSRRGAAGGKASRRRARTEQKAPSQHSTEPLHAKNANQADYIKALQDSDQVFGIGPAGTGKTYLAARIAIRKVISGDRDGIKIARPTVAKKKHQQGFLPGKLDAKLEPWLVPIMQGFKAECSQGTIDKLRADGRIEFLSFEHMRGRSFEGCVVMLDEAQNADLSDLKLFLTRVGERTQVIVSGDLDQVDIPDSGLETILDLIEDHDIPAEVVEFDEHDVVRSAIAKHWVRAFARMGK